MIPIADAHNDMLGFHEVGSAGNRLFDHADIARLKEGGVALQNFAVWAPDESPKPMQSAQRQIDWLMKLIAENPGEIALCTHKDDLQSPAHIKAILSIEAGAAVGYEAKNIEGAYKRGARILSLTWNEDCGFAGGCCAEGGLTPEGEKAVDELNRLCMAYDASHINEAGFWQAVERYEHAPCATHSNAWMLTNCPRNLKDEQIDHIIGRGGFIGVNFYTEFLRGRFADISDILRHIEYMLARGGENAVGLGSDFCGIQYTPEELNSVSDYQKIPEAMAKANYSETLIRQICYGNFENYILNFL